MLVCISHTHYHMHMWILKRYVKIDRCISLCVLCHVRFFEALWTVAHQVPLSVEFSWQEYWSGLPFSTPGDVFDPGIKPASPECPALAGRFFKTAPPGKPQIDSFSYICLRRMLLMATIDKNNYISPSEWQCQNTPCS